MKQLFITGTSSGIGKAIAERALENGHKVTGISRRNVLSHPNYRHIALDLSDSDTYLKMNFDVNKQAEAIILINNAGWLGEVKPVGRIDPESIQRAFEINLIAPAILSKMFIDQTKKNGQVRIIVNITSGAGKYPVPSWSTYCASKAGIDLFTQVMQKDHPDIHCMSVAPGIVDTAMQGEIRRVGQSDFPDVQRFVDYKEQGELTSPIEVAQKILYFIDHPDEAPDTVFSLRDIS